ncbi:MAG: glycoside hydrolase [Marinilabiliales bacterium]|nr:glycoside hydrolase [Marinilabiliales bacterium]
MNTKILLCLFAWVALSHPLVAEGKRVPGRVVDYLPASGKVYIGSPSLAILPDGSYVASHDYFGPASTEGTKAKSSIFHSQNRGRTWTKIADMDGQFWSNLFVHKKVLYLMGTWKHHGNLIIRRSTDGGHSWTEPVDSTCGLLREGEYHTAPMPMVEHNGRIYRAVENATSTYKEWGIRYSAMIFSASADADLLKASSWTASNALSYDKGYLDGKFGGWLEGNAVVTPDGDLIDFLRIANSDPGKDMAAIVQFGKEGTHGTFDPTSGFFDFVGGSRKFSIRFDPVTRLYWTLSNQILPQFSNLPAGKVRNKMVLQCSSDLRHWRIVRDLLYHPDVVKHGFQYVDWQFEGHDILYVCRTAFDDKFGGADNYHNANYMTFHRIRNFRKWVK